MKPKTRKLLIVAGVLGVLLLAALLVAPLFIDANSFRPALERMARERLGRDVTMGELSVSFLPPSVTVNDVAVAGSGDDSWLAAKAVRVRAGWAGLLSGDIEVKGIALDEPRIKLLRAPDGRLNVLELVGERKGDAKARKVSVDEVAVRGGRVEVVDAFVRPGDVVRLTLTGVTGHVGGIGSGGPLDVDISAEIEGAGRAGYRGSFGPGNVLEGHVSTKALDLAVIAPYMANRLKMASLEGLVTSELDLWRTGPGIKATGRVEVERFRLPERSSVAGASASADLDLTTDGAGRVDVRRFDLRSGSTQISARGGITASPTEQVMSLEIDAPKLSFRDLAALAAAAGTTLPLTSLDGEGLSAKGKARIVREGTPLALSSVALDGVTVTGMKIGLRKESVGGAWHLIGAKPAAKKEKKPMPILVRDLRVDGAALRLEDASVSPPAVVEIRDIKARIESWAPGEAGNLDVSAKLASGSLGLKGRVAAPGAGAKPWDARLTIIKMSLAEAAALTAPFGLRPTAGQADWSVDLKGTPGVDLTAKGRLDLKGARLPLPSGRQVTLDLPIDHDVALLSDGRVRIDALTLGLPGGPLQLDGRIQRGDVLHALRYDIGTKGPARLTPEALSMLVALAGKSLPIELELTEPMTVDARVRQAGSGLDLEGSATLAKARVRHALLEHPLDVARATVQLRGDRIEVQDAALRFGASALQGSLSIDDFANPRLEFDLTAPQANLDELFAIATRARGRSEAVAGGAGARPLSQRMRARGRLRVDSATFGGLAFSSFNTTADMRDGRLLFEPVSVGLYGGQGTGRLAMDLAGGPARFDADVNLEGVDVKALLVAGMGYQDLSGRGRLTARLQGRAGSLAETLATLKGEGTMHLTDGEISKLNALQALERASVFGEQSLASLGGRLSREGTPFNSLDGNFTIADGRMRITRSTLLAPDADIETDGTATFASKALDFDSVIAFSRQLSEQMRAEGSRAAQIFWDDRQGRVVLPARISGRVGDIKASIDWSAAGSQILRGGGLGAILGGSGSGGPSGDSGSLGGSNPLGGLLGDLLGGSNSGSSSQQSAPEAPEASGANQSQAAQGTSRGLSASIEQARMGGNFLSPDLRLRATLHGERLSHAVVIVSTPEGRELVREERAFEREVDDYLASASRDSAASIPVRLNVDASRLGGSGPFVVSVQAVDDRGRTGDAVTANVAKSSPF